MLVANGVLTPHQAEALGVAPNDSVRSAALATGATDAAIVTVGLTRLPRLDGLGVLEELRAQVRTAGLSVILLTVSQGETEENALDLGAHDYLRKPVRTRSLVARVRALLKRVSS